MSLTSALNAARSGLYLTSTWAQTTSTNIANADAEGYARRTPKVVTSGTGEPVVSEIRRAVNASYDRMFRHETARVAKQDAVASGLALYATTLGDTDAPDGLISRLTDFRGAMGLLSVSPSDAALQRAAVSDAQSLALSFNRTSDGLGEARTTAQEAVRQDVAAINGKLGQLAELNRRMALEPDESDLKLSYGDQVTQTLDQLSQLMDFQARNDRFGRTELFAPGGAPLLLGDEAKPLSFDRKLGRLFSGGIDITPGAAGVRGLSEGSLAGSIQLVNDLIPQMQAQLDTLAQGVILGFQEADPTLGPGQAGLFTDAGAAVGGAPPKPGLAGRIAVNDGVKPEAGGALWRLRDGLGAAAPGAVGDSTIVNGFLATLDGGHSFDPGAGLGAENSLTGYGSMLIAAQQDIRASAESERDALSAGAAAVQSTRMASMGVNIDDELQQLVRIEQSYAANSQVMRVVSEMVDTLLAAF
ncbi:flagellar hook-associated protein FlgK [Brevirhabdus sp.]|uniref:flagellar hook-associated protein FlgK n=1 Tax=Brevirhabdus sp. TaxID=2004514 RepID=UPI004059B337